MEHFESQTVCTKMVLIHLFQYYLSNDKLGLLFTAFHPPPCHHITTAVTTVFLPPPSTTRPAVRLSQLSMTMTDQQCAQSAVWP